jgi:uncharacterized protein involved in propanediol utilization
MTHTSDSPSLRHSVASVATSHAGEVLQGAIRKEGRTHRLLLSLPAPTLWTTADITETPGIPFSVRPTWKRKAFHAAIALLDVLQVRPPEIRVQLTTNIPVGKGCGSSTADILATLRALTKYLELQLDEEALAALIVSVEEASDSSVLSQPALFRHREGIVHEYLSGNFPDMDVLVFDTEPDTTINTVAMDRAQYSAPEMEAFEELIDMLKEAFQNRSARDIGWVATRSACISQRFLPKPHFERLVRLVADEGGYGLAVSHSGTVASVLLPPGSCAELESRITRAVEGLGIRIVTRYSLGCEAARHIAA